MTAMPSPQSDHLQFDHADFGAVAAPACARCRAPLSRTYFEIDGATGCEACARAVQLAANASLTLPALLRAFVFGAGAALAGALLWFAVAKLTGFEVGLIAIVIGMMVGRAVLSGSRGRGGALLQVMAVLLTYASITLSYVPDVMQLIINGDPSEQASVAAPGDAAMEEAAPPAEAVTATAVEEEAPPTVAQGVVALSMFFVICFAIAAAAPFLAGAENIIGILIIGVGLFEAWRITRRTTPAVVGPLDLRTPTAAT